MSNESHRVNFDPIPVSGAARPELPKIPDLPALPAPKTPSASKSAPGPIEPPAAPATPAAPTPTSWLPDALWHVIEPTRTKGVIAAGIVSLLGGAATMKYLWPAKTPTTTTPTTLAQLEPDSTPPLPALTPTLVPEKLAAVPKVEPVVLTPIVPASGGTAEIGLPAITLPALAPPVVVSPPPVPTTTSVPLPTIALPAIAPPVPSASTTFPLPELIRTGGTEPTVPVPAPKPIEKPIEIKLPDLVPSGGTTPPVPAAITLPALTAPTVAAPATSPTLLPLPGVKTDPPVPTATVPVPTLTKIEVPKETTIELPALAPTPVPSAVVSPKLPDVGVPSLAAPTVTAPTVTAPALTAPTVTAPALTEPLVSTPKIDVTPLLPEVKTTPTPAPPVTERPATVANAKTEYDIDLHYVKSGDSWAAISKQHFGDERYADALRSFNQNASLAQLQRAEVPPIHVLRKNYSTMIGRPVEKAEWGSITPSSATATEPKRSVTGNGYKMYSVPPGGRTLKEIAADAYGDEGRWGMVWDTNPKLVPDKVVPEGTKIYLTSQSKIGD